MLKIKLVSIVLLAMMTQVVVAKTSDEFPVRKLYPAVPYISVDDLHKKKDQVIIVDVRSAYEFETLRIRGAINISVSSPDFTAKVKQVRADNPTKELVMYCNGKTCKKSYKAVQKCRNAKIPNVTAYDAGIMDWAKKFPNDSELLGRTLVDPGKLIAKSDFKKRLVAPDKFEEMVGDQKTIAIDVRDSFQREGLSLFPTIDKRASLDDKVALDKYIAQAKRQNKKLLIYDATGKQVRWLMYFLQDRGFDNYVFMKGGANAYYASLRKKYVN